MERDSAIFFGATLGIGVVGFALVVKGAAEMHRAEADKHAVARIYKPSGCAYVGTVEQIPKSMVLDCSGKYEVVIWN